MPKTVRSTPKLPRKPRSAALISRDGQVLFIERHKQDKPVFFVLPGGSIKHGETPEQAAVRELKEELGVDISPGVAYRDDQETARETWIVPATLAPGQTPIWIEEYKQKPKNSYKAVWLDMDALPTLSLKPAGVYAALGIEAI